LHDLEAAGVDTRARAVLARPVCRGSTTYVRDPERDTSLPCNGSRSSASELERLGLGIHGSLAVDKGAEKKTVCSVTTVRLDHCLAGGLSAFATFPLGISMLSSGFRLPSAFGLTLTCLPATYQPQALGILAVPLVPTVRSESAIAPFAQTNPRRETETLPPGRTMPLWIRLRGTHGRCHSQRLRPEGRVTPPSRALSFNQNATSRQTSI
jgi:hypothetical protein